MANNRVSQKIIEGLREFAEALENDERIGEKFTCRKATLDLLPMPHRPKAVKGHGLGSEPPKSLGEGGRIPASGWVRFDPQGRHDS